ncbi:Glycerol-3-phosphate acyltransferase 3 [Chionoecetes opilio]|uniref:Glycerol-3-phosphate acyltransferase 3 n=1 Tax=Chionoecetes opilio TaxID=41210 RepID=A0A8J4YBJ0_CHIOP|nr:Glycerol-3-phosphate acyltransferase 3 [Chionoecetes opilio]
MERSLVALMSESVEEAARYLSSLEVWEAVRPFVLWGQLLVFVCFLLAATTGRRLRLRRKYVDLLDRVFNFAAFRLSDSTDDEEDEDEEGATSSDEEVVICPESPRAEPASPEGSFQFQDPLPYLAAGMRAVVSDCVTKSFTSAELRTWNMLSRTKRQRYLRASPSLTVFWAVGFVLRWVFLMPVRVLLLVISLTTLVVLCAAVGLLPSSPFKRRLNAKVVMWCFDFVAGSLSIVARFHNPEHRPHHGIAVANHTSPIDSMVLATDQCYDMSCSRWRGATQAADPHKHENRLARQRNKKPENIIRIQWEDKAIYFLFLALVPLVLQMTQPPRGGMMNHSEYCNTFDNT